MKFGLAAAIIGVLLASAQPTAASVTAYTDEATFQSAAKGRFTLVNLDAAPFTSFGDIYYVEDPDPSIAFVSKGVDFLFANAPVSVFGSSIGLPKAGRSHTIVSGVPAGLGDNLAFDLLSPASAVGLWSDYLSGGTIRAYDGPGLTGNLVGEAQLNDRSYSLKTFAGLASSDSVIRSVEYACEFSIFSSMSSPALCHVFDIQFASTDCTNFEDSVRGAVKASAGRGMVATFRPKCGFNLEEAARLGGFDHFNWVQFVERDSVLQDPSDPHHSFHRQALQTMSGPSSVRFLDPAPGGFYYMTELAGSPGRFPIADRKAGYWDEEYNYLPGFFDHSSVPPHYYFVGRGPLSWQSAELGENTRDEDPLVPGLDTLRFNDAPSGADYEFLTCLAGIGGTVGLKILNSGGLDACFRWKYTRSLGPVELLGYLLAPEENPYSLGTTTFEGFVQEDGFSPAELDMISQLEAASRPSGVSAPPTSLLLPLALAVLAATRVRRRSVMPGVATRVLRFRFQPRRISHPHR